LGHRLKRWLFIVHRWLGIVSCLLFAMWFLSGLVMIYVPFPALEQSERLAGLPKIDWRLVRTSLAAPLRTGALDAPPRILLLEMRGALPIWRASLSGNEERDFLALDGAPLSPPTERQARDIAERFGRRPIVDVMRVERDQWTVAGGFDRHRPLWKAELAGSDGRILYVSGKTGAVVLDTDARERFWNWLGSVPHWLYPTVLRQNNTVWRQVVMWVSGPCIVAGVTGFWIGILRTRFGRRRYKSGRMSPYRGWMAWHHWTGLVGGVFLIAWIFSGWLSVDPFRLFASGGVDPAAKAAYERVDWPGTPDYSRLARIAEGAKQVELAWVGGRPLLELRWPERTLVLDERTLQPFRPRIAPSVLVPGSRITAIERLTAPDVYWYDVGKLPRLPVLRVRFDDPAQTWVYLDPASGRLLGDIDARGRLYRWLFDLLHKWDLNQLTLNRPAWDVLLWVLSILGLITSISGIWIGWKRLVRTRPIAQSARPRAASWVRPPG
jgi:uncharacterized iron-regulated membrane protein